MDRKGTVAGSALDHQQSREFEVTRDLSGWCGVMGSEKMVPDEGLDNFVGNEIGKTLRFSRRARTMEGPGQLSTINNPGSSRLPGTLVAGVA